MDLDVIEKILLPQLLPLLDFKSHTTTEITENFVANFGQICFHLSKKGLLMQNKTEFIQFFKDMLIHEDEKIKLKGIYILPCMHVLFKEVQEECEIDFCMTYQQLLGEDGKVRRKTAMSLHEVFIMFHDTEEDMQGYKECFNDLLGDDTVKILKIINNNLTTILFNYINNFGKSTAVSPKSEGPRQDDDNPFMH